MYGSTTGVSHAETGSIEGVGDNGTGDDSGNECTFRTAGVNLRRGAGHEKDGTNCENVIRLHHALQMRVSCRVDALLRRLFTLFSKKGSLRMHHRGQRRANRSRQ